MSIGIIEGMFWIVCIPFGIMAYSRMYIFVIWKIGGEDLTPRRHTHVQWWCIDRCLLSICDLFHTIHKEARPSISISISRLTRCEPKTEAEERCVTRSLLSCQRHVNPFRGREFPYKNVDKFAKANHCSEGKCANEVFRLVSVNCCVDFHRTKWVVTFAFPDLSYLPPSASKRTLIIGGQYYMLRALHEMREVPEICQLAMSAVRCIKY